MRFNPSSNVRTGMYVFSVFINAVMGVLLTSSVVVPVVAVALLAGFNAVVALMAGANVTPDEQ